MTEQPLGFQRKPVFQAPIDIAQLVDLDSGKMLVKRGGLFVACGMTLNEAMSSAAHWWEHTARFAMPHNRASADEINDHGIASAMWRGEVWDKLEKDEKLRILQAWWTKVGAPSIIGESE